jgi:hypothetical protein
MVPDPQQPEHELADRPADCTRNQADDERSEDRVRDAVKDRPSLEDRDQGLDVHEDLRAAEHHEAEMLAADSLEGGAWSEVKRREGYQRLATVTSFATMFGLHGATYHVDCRPRRHLRKVSRFLSIDTR